MQVSLDGGKTWQEAPDGVRVVYEDVPIPGEDDDGELHLNCTHEGLILDVWGTDYSGGSYNVGTSSEMAEEIVERLTAANT